MPILILISIISLLLNSCSTNKTNTHKTKKIKTKYKIQNITPNEISINNTTNYTTPNKIIKTTLSITDKTKINNYILFSSSNGNIIQLKNNKINNIVKRNNLIFSLDKINSMLTWTEEVNAKSKLILMKNKKINTLIESKQKFYKVRFINNDNILVALLTSEIILFSISKNKIIYKKQISTSGFSDLSLSPNKKQALLSNEGGQYILFNTYTGNIIKIIQGLHKDKIMAVDMNNNYIISGGQDRRIAIYNNIQENAKYSTTSFIVNKVAIHNNYIAFPINDKNHIMILNISNSKKLILKGHNSIINSISFINNKKIISSSEDGYIHIWKIP